MKMMIRKVGSSKLISEDDDKVIIEQPKEGS